MSRKGGCSGSPLFSLKGLYKMNEENEIFDSENKEKSKIEMGAGAAAAEAVKKSAGKELLEWVQAIVIAVVLALLIRNFVFTVVRVDGQSMEPTLHNNDRMIVWRLGYEPKAGDIVIFNPPGYDKSIYWVKRVIALEGQHVEIDYYTNSVYVDGEKLDEEYLGEEMLAQQTITEVDVPEGCVFVLGDNRNHSTDGRVIGPIDKDTVIGRAVFRFWPLGKWSLH